MDNNSFLSNLKDFILRNKQIIMAYILSFAVIAIVIMFFSFLKKDNPNTIASYGELSLESTSDESSYETTAPSTTDNQESNSSDNTTNDDSTLSDMDFTLPEDATEETETTLKPSSYPYLIKVNRLLNCVTVYKQNDKGEYTVPHKSMACSTGLNIMNTPVGTFKTSSKYTWRQMVDGTHSQYATRVYGGILFHSVPCYSPKKDQLEYMEFNKLGNPASLGCIRLTVEDSKWIYDNCPYGTTVVIYDDATSPGPLGKPQVIKIPENSPYRDWDPTDPDPKNPWHNCSPAITASDITIKAGSDINILSTVKATDTCGNDISSSVSISGKYDKNTSGTYEITLSVKDLLGRSASKKINIIVTKNSDGNTTTTKPIKPTENTTTPTYPSVKPTTPSHKPTETTPEQTTPEQTTPEQTTPEQTTPEETTPEETTPEQTTPEQTTPDEITSEESSSNDDTAEHISIN